jgi:hypothetical protein
MKSIYNDDLDNSVNWRRPVIVILKLMAIAFVLGVIVLYILCKNIKNTNWTASKATYSENSFDSWKNFMENVSKDTAGIKNVKVEINTDIAWKEKTISFETDSNTLFRTIGNHRLHKKEKYDSYCRSYGNECIFISYRVQNKTYFAEFSLTRYRGAQDAACDDVYQRCIGKIEAQLIDTIKTGWKSGAQYYQFHELPPYSLICIILPNGSVSQVLIDEFKDKLPNFSRVEILSKIRSMNFGKIKGNDTTRIMIYIDESKLRR